MLTKGLRIEMGYWITITAVIILQAYPSATWQRAIQRVGGTLLGGLIAVGTAFVLHGPAAIVIVVVPLSLLSMAFRGVSYTLYIVCITPLFILITELVNRGGLLSPELGGLRILDNMVGAAIGMLATFMLWPSWEANFLRLRLAEDLRATGAFCWRRSTPGWELRPCGRRITPVGRPAWRETTRRRHCVGRWRNRGATRSHQIAAAMAITAAARRLAGIAALIMQSPPVPDAMARHRRNAPEPSGKSRGCRRRNRERKSRRPQTTSQRRRTFADRGRAVRSLAAAQRSRLKRRGPRRTRVAFAIIARS